MLSFQRFLQGAIDRCRSALSLLVEVHPRRGELGPCTLEPLSHAIALDTGLAFAANQIGDHALVALAIGQ
jgi:hypothetical protein